MTKTITNKDVRDYLGHDGSNCKVKIKSGGKVWMYGSADAFDRTWDWWHFIGDLADIKIKMFEISELH